TTSISSSEQISRQANRFGQIVEKSWGLRAVDDAMITRERERHHRTNGGLAVHRNNAIADAADGENRDLGRRDDRVESIDVVHAEIRDRKSASGDISRLQFFASRALREFFSP